MPRDAASLVIMAAIEGLEPSREELDFLEKEQPAGLTLFKRNISESFDECRSLCRKLTRFDSSLLLAIDQEGGRVARIPAPFPNEGAALGLSSYSLVFLENYGFCVGACLKALGINWNFAPVCDILTREDNEAIGDRVFAYSAQEVIERAGAFLLGMERAGVAGCLKHFPGQGDANFDTHLGSAIIELEASIFEQRELEPFKKLMNSTRAIMVSHAIYPHLDEQIASLSAPIMQELLRGQLGFEGLVVSDDMNMKAVAQDDTSWKEAMVASIAAGCDLLLICRHLDRCQMALEALRKESARSLAFNKRLEEAAGRVKSFRLQLR